MQQRIQHIAILFMLGCIKAWPAPDAVLEWAGTIGGPGGGTDATSAAVDDAGDVYMVGYFSGTVDFFPVGGTYTLDSKGHTGFFLAKIDGSGGLAWVRQFEGSGYAHGKSISVHSDGSIVVTGTMGTTLDFDSGPEKAELTSENNEEAFVAKFTNVGEHVWSRLLGDERVRGVSAVSFTNDGAVILCGALTHEDDEDENGYVMKLNGDGKRIWLRRLRGPGSVFVEDIASDRSGNVYCCGRFDKALQLEFTEEPGEVSANETDVFFAKYDADGKMIWVRALGAEFIANCFGIAVDKAGNLYATGNYHGKVKVDAGSGVLSFEEFGQTDVYVIKIDPNGGVLWSRQFGGKGEDIGNRISVDDVENVYVAGGVRQTVDLDPGAGVYEVSPGGQLDVFVAKFDETGAFLWAGHAGGTGNDIVHDLVVPDFDHAILVGTFHAAADLDPSGGALVITPKAESMDSFVIKVKGPVIQGDGANRFILLAVVGLGALAAMTALLKVRGKKHSA